MERIGREVERELARTGDRDTAAISRIVDVWHAAVGEAVARNAWPLRVGRDGTLHVATSSSTWAFELDRLSPEIAERLAGVLGPSAPAVLRFRPGPLPEPPPPAPASPEEPRAEAATTPPEVAAEAASAAAAIEDPELREVVERAARASLARAWSGRQI
jgi:Dna[CI] antecedent, DciA